MTVCGQVLVVGLLCVVCECLALAQPGDVQPGGAQVKAEKVTHEVNRLITYDYFVNLPAGYEQATERWPMILHLHGSGSSLSGVKESTEVFNRPFVLVQPHSPGGWDPDTLAQLVKEVLAKYEKIDPDRVYLIGYSMGGRGAWELAGKHPYLFAAVAPIASWGDPMSATNNLIGMPIWAFHGAKDTTIEPEMAQIVVDAINKRGGNARLTLFPDVGHGSHGLAADNGQLYEWFLQHSRQILARDEYVEKVGICKRTATAPAVDGNVADPAWKNAEPLSEFVYNRGGLAAVPTVVRMLCDEKALYISEIAYEPHLAGMAVVQTERDGSIWEDDCLEVMLDTTNSQKDYFHFVVNPNGVLYDGKQVSVKWDCPDIAVKTARRGDAWTLEMAVPWASLDMEAPKEGQTIRAEFARSRYIGNARITSQWAPTLGWNHVPTRFGTIRFVEGK